ncbi:MAG: glycine cleavage system protein GcvH [Deltaproteobacteria bacterium]
MAYPDDLKYTKDHEWARIAGSRATIGITEFAQEQLGDVVYVELPKVGDMLRKGETFGVVESTKAVSELFAPVSGQVIEVNGPLVDGPETINEDPYEEGWMIQVELTDLKETTDLLSAKDYEAFVEDSKE